MSIVYRRPTPRTNWLTVGLLVLLVAGFGVFAETHLNVGSATTVDAQAPAGHDRTIASVILEHS